MFELVYVVEGTGMRLRIQQDGGREMVNIVDLLPVLPLGNGGVQILISGIRTNGFLAAGLRIAALFKLVAIHR
jgi:hypothetical protein